ESTTRPSASTSRTRKASNGSSHAHSRQRYRSGHCRRRQRQARQSPARGPAEQQGDRPGHQPGLPPLEAEPEQPAGRAAVERDADGRVQRPAHRPVHEQADPRRHRLPAGRGQAPGRQEDADADPRPLHGRPEIRKEALEAMKKEIHPEYREVVFLDAAANFSFLTRSTVKTNQTIKWEDGKTYPLVRLDISSASHPFFTGKMKLVDSTGQIERFRKRFGDAKKPGEKK